MGPDINMTRSQGKNDIMREFADMYFTDPLPTYQEVEVPEYTGNRHERRKQKALRKKL